MRKPHHNRTTFWKPTGEIKEQERIEAAVKKRLQYAFVDTEAQWAGFKRPLGYTQYINERAEELRKEFELDLKPIKKVA